MSRRGAGRKNMKQTDTTVVSDFVCEFGKIGYKPKARDWFIVHKQIIIVRITHQQ